LLIHIIGHSTRSIEQFLSLLKAHRLERLADIRSIPRSRRHPHFSREALAVALPGAGIAYLHMPALGGLRKPRPDSANTAWRHEGFRGYADYMQTAGFERALDELVAYASHAPTAIMCAEAVWWQCHRQLVADALVARGVEVRHVMAAGDAPVHALTSFARLVGGRVLYGGTGTQARLQPD